MIAGAQYTIVDLSDPIQQGTAPANPVTGMLWLDTSASPPMLRRWNGTSWEDVGDSGAGAEALEEINKLKAWNEIVVGTQTSATASWTGTVSFDSMTDGMQMLEYVGMPICRMKSSSDFCAGCTRCKKSNKTGFIVLKP